jgi:drug/metabolite transporter (DMT)-like permease
MSEAASCFRETSIHMSPLKGIACKLIAVVLLSSMSAWIKWIGDAVPTGQVVFARSLFAIPPILIYMAWCGVFPGALKTARPLGHAWRGGIGITAMGLSFAALVMLPLPDVVTLGFAAPLITVLLAPFMLGERVGIYRTSAVLVGFVGVLVALSPHLIEGLGAPRTQTEQMGALIALASAVCVALAMIQIRKLTATEASHTIAFYFSVSGTLMGLATLPWGWVIPSATHALSLVAIGVIGGIGQIFLTESYRHAPTSVIAPFDYTALLFAIGLSMLIFNQTPEMVVLVGATIIIAAGMFVIFRERQLGIKRGKGRSAGSGQTV